MAAPELTCMPASFAAGTTVVYTRTLSDYPANGGWSLAVYITGLAAPGYVTGVASGANYTVTLSAAATAALTAGEHKWEERVTSGGNVYTADSSTVTVLPNIATATSSQMMTQNERDLAAVQAVIDGRITGDIEAYTIGTRSVTKIPLHELYELRTALHNAIAAERAGSGFIREGRFVITGTANER